MQIRNLACCLSVFAALAMPLPASALTWGINGHAYSKHPEVWADVETQFATMQHYGFTTYRVSVPLTDSNPDVADKFAKMLELAAKYHITVHPTLILPFHFNDETDGGKYPATEAGLEQQGYNRTYPFVLRFASQVNEWELENEVTLKKGVRGNEAKEGMSASDFDTPAGHQWAALLRGMSKAVRAAQKITRQPLRTMVDTWGEDFGLFPFLESNGVAVDDIGYHYYPHLRSVPTKQTAHDKQKYDLFAVLGRLEKPVFINEFNAGEPHNPKHGEPYNDAEALASLKGHIPYLTSQNKANIRSVEYYELYDEPWLEAGENNFGLMKDAGHLKTQMLVAAVYACGQLSAQEQNVLIQNGLFTQGELAGVLNSCRR